MSPHESDGPGSSREVGSQQTTVEINQLLEGGFENISADILWSLAKRTIARCDELADDVEFGDSITYEGVIGPLIEIDDMVIQVANLLTLVSMLHPDEAERKNVNKTIEAFLHDANGYSYKFGIRKKVHSYSLTKEPEVLGAEEAHYHDTVLDWFEMAGGNLPRSQRKKVRRIHNSLIELEGKFESNITEDKTQIIFTNDKLVGLDEKAKNEYLTKLDDGRFALNMVDACYSGFLTLASNRDARRIAYEAYNTRSKDENSEVLQEIVYKRQSLAKRLGFDSWLDLGNRYNMADSPASIVDMYAGVIGPITAQAKREIAVMESMLEADGYNGPLQEYDWRYYEEKLFQEMYGIGLDKAREYFPLSTALNGVFELTGELFGVSYRPSEAKTWHHNVFAYDVLDRDGSPLGSIFFDLFPRDGKYKYCCTVPLINGRAMADGSYRQPSTAIIANMPPPTEAQPTLVSQQQRVDLFHEFGHALHHLMGRAKLPSLGSMGTEIDFVEIPSQLMENWAWDKNSLLKHSAHYQTGEPIPEKMADLLIDSQRVNVGIRYLRSASLALFDLSLHNTLEPIDLREKWSQAVAVSAFPEVPGTFFPATFDHLASDYGGAYYSYFYDEFFCADIFERFEQEGLTDSRLGNEYRRKMLEPGASKFGFEMVRNFLGRESGKKALMLKLGQVMIAEA